MIYSFVYQIINYLIIIIYKYYQFVNVVEYWQIESKDAYNIMLLFY